MSGPERSGDPDQRPKEDPQTLVLRGRPRPVIRFRRGLIIALSAAAGSVLVALAWSALEPRVFEGAADNEPEVAASAPPDGVAGAPASYADVPRLGPPLPGDLGRAIVEGQSRPSGAGRTKPDRAQAGVGKLESALESPVLARLSQPSAPAVSGQSRTPESGAGQSPTLNRSSPADRQRGKETELPVDGEAMRAGPGQAGPLSTLAAGTVIPASLLTGLNSDLPGIVVAQVTANVRDTATGRTVLIPQGARLLGEYDSHVEFGQKRAFLAWNRLLFPDGSSVDLGGIAATDAAGHSGLEDEVDIHEWRLLKGVLLASLVGLGDELGNGGDDRDLVRALRESGRSNASRAGEQIVSRNLDVRPSLTVRPGWPVRALLHRDLLLKPWREN